MRQRWCRAAMELSRRPYQRSSTPLSHGEPVGWPSRQKPVRGGLGARTIVSLGGAAFCRPWPHFQMLLSAARFLRAFPLFLARRRRRALPSVLGGRNGGFPPPKASWGPHLLRGAHERTRISSHLPKRSKLSSRVLSSCAGRRPRGVSHMSYGVAAWRRAGASGSEGADALVAAVEEGGFVEQGV